MVKRKKAVDEAKDDDKPAPQGDQDDAGQVPEPIAGPTPPPPPGFAHIERVLAESGRIELGLIASDPNDVPEEGGTEVYSNTLRFLCVDVFDEVVCSGSGKDLFSLLQGCEAGLKAFFEVVDAQKEEDTPPPHNRMGAGEQNTIDLAGDVSSSSEEEEEEGEQGDEEDGEDVDVDIVSGDEMGLSDDISDDSTGEGAPKT